MADRPIDIYLNDHLAGSVLGSDLAEQLCKANAGKPLGETMETLSAEIDEDRETLLNLMDRMGTSKNPVKQATAWLAEKGSRVKFSGMSSGEPDVGTFMALEALALGVQGKGRLWVALKAVREDYEPLQALDLDALLARADSQYATLERERIAAGKQAITVAEKVTAERGQVLDQAEVPEAGRPGQVPLP